MHRCRILQTLRLKTHLIHLSHLYFAGFNPVWEETITFILTFPDLAVFRFVVWDEDPIGRDFIGQVTLPFSSIMQGKMFQIKIIYYKRT